VTSGREFEDGSGSAYKAAGVDIDAQDEALSGIKGLVRSTNNSNVLSDVGNFGGLFRLPIEGMEEPVLVASADGVGTKLMVARMAGNYGTVGRDLVNHCVNDILVQGARPLFFMDYVGAGVLEPSAMLDLVSGVVAGCRENDCVLLGGETAEMPGFYDVGDYELVGFVVGLVDRPRILDGKTIEAGDVLLGLPSAGLHTNGYSLARKVFLEMEGLALDDPMPGTAHSVESELLAPHVSYLRPLEDLLTHPGLHGLAHITGGGLTDNLPRILPGGLGARIVTESWRPQAVFVELERRGGIARSEMFRVFNMGIGMVVVVAPDAVAEFMGHFRNAGQEAVRVGSVAEDVDGVVYD
jgi:phosphoribosylformylglycinamidine cyclo-ligase